MKALSTLNIFFRLLGMGKRYLAWYIGLSFITVLLSTISVAEAEVFRRLANAAADQDMELLFQTVALAIGIVLIRFFGSVFNTYVSQTLHVRSTMNMQSSLLNKVLRSKVAELDKYHSADIINRIDESVREAQVGVNIRAQAFLANILQIVFILSYLSFMNVWLTFGGLVIASILPLIINLCSGPMRTLYEQRQHAIVAKEALVQDVIQGAEIVRSYSLTNKMRSAVEKAYNPYLKHHFKLKGYEVGLFRSHTFIWIIGVLYAFGVGGYLISNNQMEVGDVVAFAIVFERFAFPLSSLSGLWAQFQSSIAHGRRIFELLDTEEEPKPDQVAILAEINSIHLKDVHFSYDPPSKALNGVKMTIEKGKSTALIGPSGSGKSTIAHLLMFLYEPSSGDILNGTQRIQDVGISNWRQRIAYIPQQPIIFSGTIFDNIALGKEGATLDEVIAAAKSAQIHQSIIKTDQKYDTQIGEGGLQLSGGEKQRIAIARAFLRNPELVILDEPTSALDQQHETLIMKEIAELFLGKTVLIISHRFSTIQMADHIVFLENGKVVESGSHHELMQKQERYYEMFYANQKEGVI